MNAAGGIQNLEWYLVTRLEPFPCSAMVVNWDPIIGVRSD